MQGADYTIRPSRDEDVAAITAIYGHHVLHGLASFEEVPPSVEDTARGRGDVVARCVPDLVAEREGRIVGYCCAGPFRPRIGYLYALEDSIYIDAGEVGRGIGRRLLAPLIERCTELGYRQMIAVIGGRETVASIRLHEALGFTHIGVFPAIGFKFGRWIDTVLMQCALGPGSETLPSAGTPSAAPGRLRRSGWRKSLLISARPRATTRTSTTMPKPVRLPSGCARRSATASVSSSAAGATSPLGRIPCRCIRPRSPLPNSRALSRG